MSPDLGKMTAQKPQAEKCIRREPESDKICCESKRESRPARKLVHRSGTVHTPLRPYVEMWAVIELDVIIPHTCNARAPAVTFAATACPRMYSATRHRASFLTYWRTFRSVPPRFEA